MICQPCQPVFGHLSTIILVSFNYLIPQVDKLRLTSPNMKTHGTNAKPCQLCQPVVNQYPISNTNLLYTNLLYITPIITVG